MDAPILVSACLVGFRCRYDGTSKKDSRVFERLEGKAWIPVCPEQCAGFSTPREPIQFSGGTGREVWRGEARIVQVSGKDMTTPLLEASRSLLDLVRRFGIRRGILKERSPSCGVFLTYLGGEVVEGMGVFAALLSGQGIGIVSEESLGEEGWESADDF